MNSKIPKLISPKDASEKLQISTKTLGRLGLTKYKINSRMVRYSEEEIAQWLEKQKVKFEVNKPMEDVSIRLQARLSKSNKLRANKHQNTEMRELAKLLGRREYK